MCCQIPEQPKFQPQSRIRVAPRMNSHTGNPGSPSLFPVFSGLTELPLLLALQFSNKECAGGILGILPPLWFCRIGIFPVPIPKGILTDSSAPFLWLLHPGGRFSQEIPFSPFPAASFPFPFSSMKNSQLFSGSSGIVECRFFKAGILDGSCLASRHSRGLNPKLGILGAGENLSCSIPGIFPPLGSLLDPRMGFWEMP